MQETMQKSTPGTNLSIQQNQRTKLIYACTCHTFLLKVGSHWLPLPTCCLHLYLILLLNYCSWIIQYFIANMIVVNISKVLIDILKEYPELIDDNDLLTEEEQTLKAAIVFIRCAWCEFLYCFLHFWQDFPLCQTFNRQPCSCFLVTY